MKETPAGLLSPLLLKFPEIEHCFQWANELRPSQLFSAKQVHGTQVWQPQKNQPPTDLAQHQPAPVCADGILLSHAQTPNARAGIQTADCVPILIYAKAPNTQSIVSAVHAGWRGMHQGILPEAIQKTLAQGFKPEQIYMAIGPCIQQCCFEVAPNVIDSFQKDWGFLWGQKPTKDQPISTQQPAPKYKTAHQAPVGPNNTWLDLNKIALYQAQHLGIPPENLDSDQTCTYCSDQKLQSFRRSTHQSTKAGRQWSWIGFRQ